MADQLESPARHVIECREPYFTLLKSGAKTVEGRKGTAKYVAIKRGDIVEFRDGCCGVFEAHVVGVRRYLTVRDYLIAETLEKTLPGVADLDAGENVYLGLGWTEAEVATYGVVAIRVVRG
jgi:ASC-1-like (ASCH) protein